MNVWMSMVLPPASTGMGERPLFPVWRRVRSANCGRHRVEIERHYDGDTLGDAGQ